MLLAMGRGSKIILGVALLLSLVIVVHLSSFPALANWKLPSPASWTRPLTGDPPENNIPLIPDGEWDPIEHDTSLPAPPTTSNVSTMPASPEYPPTYPPTYPPIDPSLEVDDAVDTNFPSLPCSSLEGGEDVVVVMRTGATETLDKLPVHLNTTFQCYQNLAIFSDYGEYFQGFEIHDVFKNIPDEIKSTRDDFKHYLHIQEAGREGLDPSELSGAISEETGDGSGKDDNAGWRLDKWKFLPMVNETLALYPDKKWYVFIEPDSYLVWSNFLQWLPQLDPDKASYFGSEVGAGDITFAHGGSVFLLTRPAMEAVAKAFNDQTDDLLSFTEHHWAGDAVLGKTLKDNGVPLTFTWPQFQGGNPAYTLQWEDKKGDSVLWCAPALSYHHLIPSEVADLFDFEQGWIEDVKQRVVDRRLTSRSSEADVLLHHKDTFRYLIMPNLTTERQDWDAKADNDHQLTTDMNLGECKEICQANPECMHYVLGPEGCATGTNRNPDNVRLGQKAVGYQSGWMIERIQEWVEKMDHCSGTGWTTP